MQYSKLLSAMSLFACVIGSTSARAEQGPPQPGEIEIPIVAKQFDFTPGSSTPIVLKIGQPVVLEVTTKDRRHGFFSQELGIDETMTPGKTTYIHLNPTQAGTFTFHCSVFCGSGHDGMEGTIIVQ